MIIKRTAVILAGALLISASSNAQQSTPTPSAPPAAQQRSSRPAPASSTAPPTEPAPPDPKNSQRETATVTSKANPTPAETATGAVIPAPNQMQAKAIRALLRMPKEPPSRTICVFDAPSGNDSTSLTWDPMHPGSLIRSTTLQSGVRYKVACTSEALRPITNADKNCAWSFTPADVTPATKLRELIAISPGNCEPKDEDVKQAEITWQAVPKLAGVTMNVPSHASNTSTQLEVSSFSPIGDAARFDAVGPTSTPRLRTLSGVEEQAVHDLLQTVADILVERVKAAGLRVVQAQLRELFCTELRLKSGSPPLLPRTCQVIAGLKLDDLAASAQSLVTAFASDLLARAFAARFNLVKEQPAPPGPPKPAVPSIAVQRAVSAAMSILARRYDDAHGSALGVLVALGEDSQTVNAAVTTPPSCETLTPDCGKRLVRAALWFVDQCHRTRTCDAAHIRFMANNLDRYFEGGENIDAALKRHWPTFDDFVIKAEQVLSPGPSATEADQLVAAVMVTAEALEKIQGHACDPRSLDKITQSPSMQWDELPGFDEGSCFELGLFREALDASMHVDLPRLAVAAIPLINARHHHNISDKKLLRVAEMAGSLGLFMNTNVSGTKPTEQELKDRKEARKAAIERFIDANTSREHRRGTAILSVGGALGVLQPFADYELGVAGMLGLALDASAPASWGSTISKFGIQIQLMPINLGAYLRRTSQNKEHVVTPAIGDVASPSATAAITFTLADILLFVGGNVGLLPGSDRDGASKREGYVGLLGGAYIPFFDFN